MTNQNDSALLRMHYRQQFRISFAMEIAYRSGLQIDWVYENTRIQGIYPDYRIWTSDELNIELQKHGICMEPYFEEPYLTAVRKNFDK